MHHDHVFLRGLLLLGFEGLLAIALYHDNGEEAADNGRTKDDEDDRDADGPDAWEEERVKEMVVVDEWLRESACEDDMRDVVRFRAQKEESHRTMNSVQTV
jgi:hypothetical protein